MVSCAFLFKTFILLMTTITFIEMIEGVRAPVQISKDLANNICQQRTRFHKRGVMEEPIRTRYRPISPLRCGWYSFGNCDKSRRCSYQKYEECPSDVKERKIFPTRIHGGVEAQPHSHPSMVILSRKDGICGAVIIATDWVLTAAHCTAGLQEQDIILLAGRHNMGHEESMEQIIYPVKKIREHYKYNPDPTIFPSDDICLLELYQDEKFTFNQYVNYAVPASASYVATGRATLVGWGDREDGSYLGPLYEVEMTVTSDEDCRKYYGGWIQKGNICTFEMGKSGCSGDSGGPLYQFVDGDAIIIGINSGAGPNCSHSNMPTIFAEVSYYAEWISKIRQKF